MQDSFDVLLQGMSIQFECFASPLNCRYGRFCSAFPDTDMAFGSLGSFFEFRPQQGSYEVARGRGRESCDALGCKSMSPRMLADFLPLPRPTPRSCQSS